MFPLSNEVMTPTPIVSHLESNMAIQEIAHIVFFDTSSKLYMIRVCLSIIGT